MGQGRLSISRLLAAACWALIAGWAYQAGAQPVNLQVNEADNASPDLDNATSQSEPSHAVFGSTVVVGWNDTAQVAEFGTEATSLQGYAVSTDGGLTFTDMGPLEPVPGFTNITDPALAVDSAGNFYYAAIAGPVSTFAQTRVAVARSTSTSPTVTFDTPVHIEGLLDGSIQDKEFIAIDTTGGLNDGRVYVAWSEFADLFDQNPRILFARSTSTSPLTFAPTMALSPADGLSLGAMPAVGPNGEVYVVWSSDPLGAGDIDIRLVKSTDGGATFANPDVGDPAADKTIASVTPTVTDMASGGISIRTRSFAYIAVDHTPIGSATRGNVYVVFQADPDDDGDDRSDIFFTRSTDGGSNWSAPRRINAGPAVTINKDTTDNDNWQPFIAVSPVTGQILVTFYDRRNDALAAIEDPDNTDIELFKAVSTDAGLTWFNEPVSDVAFTPAVAYDIASASDYRGDYNYATADASGFHLTWGDTRNTCAPPVDAMNGCSPAGRGDMDVFYAREDALTGPDLAITPWGNITGVGPRWRSPDIFVVDDTEAETNATKGQINHLRARIRNVGDAAAETVIVRFSYAPWFAGIPDSALKEIGTVEIDLAAKGDGAGADLQIAEIDWDLTDLNDTNDGEWPKPVDDFTHFCVKVSVEFPEDVNQANNNAQNNFFDVPTIAERSVVSFIIGNPFKRAVDAKLVLENLPRGFGANLADFEVDFGEPFKLKASEIKVATLVFDPPRQRRRARVRDAVAELGLMIDRELVGGLSVRLAAAGALAADFDSVFKAVLTVLKRKNEPVSLADKDKGLINTASIPVDGETLQRIVGGDIAKRLGQHQGRYLLSFFLKKIDAKTTQLRVKPLIIVSSRRTAGILGGQGMPSAGVLEREHLRAVARLLAR